MSYQTQLSFGPPFRPRSAPVTFWYIVSAAAMTLLLFAASLSPASAERLASLLVFDPAAWPARPWTLLTYPFVNAIGPFWFLLLGYMLWWCGSDLERWWGSRVQAGFLVAVALASALLLSLGVALTPGLGTVRLAGAEPLVAALFTVWGLRNPEATIILIVVPVTGLVVALLSAATVWWSYGVYHGLFVALGSAGVGALYLSQGHRLHRLLKRFRPDPRDKAARQRDKRFQQIMEKSGLRLVDDEEKRPR